MFDNGFNKARKVKVKVPNAKNAFITQPISQADGRQEQTNVAMPSDENVELNRGWVIDNKR